MVFSFFYIASIINKIYFQYTFLFQLPTEIAHVLCQPIIQANGEIVAVLELWRRDSGGPFHEEDEEIASSYLVWGGIALHYAQLYLNMNQQKKLNDFLLLVVK